MFEKLSNVLRSKFGRKDYISRNLEIVRIFDIYREEISRQFPGDRETRPVSLKNKTLTIQTGSSVQANELRFFEQNIIEKINTEMKNEVLIRVVYHF